jgi:hypothetical protein
MSRGCPPLIPASNTHLVAESLNISLRELLALAELLDPGVDFVLHHGLFYFVVMEVGEVVVKMKD